MNLKFDFSETNTFVYLTFYKSPLDLKADPQLDNPLVSIKSGNILCINKQELELFEPVEISSIENFRFKIEIGLKKHSPKKWYSFNGEYKEPILNEHIYINYDRTDEQDNESLMDLFKKIYDGGSDDVKRAMNKSLEESGGTVLSTDWEKVKNKKVEPNK